MPDDSITSAQRPLKPQVGVPAGAPAWVTPELIELTIRVWQPRYRVSLTPEDALELILTAGQLFAALDPLPQRQRG